MSLLKSGRPSQDKDKIIKKMQQEEKGENLRWCQVKIPATLRRDIDINTAIHNITLTELVIKLLKQYLREEEKQIDEGTESSNKKTR